jgi:hypothetical protein
LTSSTPHPKGAFDAANADWRRAAGSTVEVAFYADLIGLRDAENPDGPVLVFTQGEWDAFVGGARDGEFDLD